METLYYSPVSEPDPYFASLAKEARSKGFECVVDAIAIGCDLRLLLLKRATTKWLFPGCWDLPGGHVRANESLESALRREVKEEIGASIRSIDALIAVWNWEEPQVGGKSIKRVRQFEFMVTLEAGPLRLDRNDFSELRWISENELPLVRENREPDDTHMLAVVRNAFVARRRHL